MARNKTNCKQTASSLRFNSKIPLKLKLETVSKERIRKKSHLKYFRFESAFATIQFHDGLVLRSMLLKGNLKEGGGGGG